MSTPRPKAPRVRTAPQAPPAELLLGRPEFAGDLDLGWAAAGLAGRRVLVTGAAGSVGWPLAQILLGTQPARLVLLDHHEYSLFSLERALGRPSEQLVYQLMDIGDGRRLEELFAEERPEIVIHLAAAKHVPYAERFPEGAVASNVLATARLLRLAERAGTVEAFIYPSSDKSVDPPSLYGATKRICEALVQSRAGERRWGVVRFVNIIGTRGSVIETFTQQVLEDRPLGVTDERMTRYWISMHEALWCLVLAAQGTRPGEVIMPACGEPVPLLETARRLAGWYRPDRVPYPIACTGVRPGERLHEVLLSANEVFAAESADQGLRRVRTSRDPARVAEVAEVVEELRRCVELGDRERLRQACLAAARGLQ